LARNEPAGSGYQISFAESKGCKRSLQTLVTAPNDWKNQSENGDFVFKGSLLAITQYLLIATRVYPHGKRTKTRRIQVRAWNSSKLNAVVPFAAFRDVLVAHYFGVCERIGLTANAQLLALRNYSPLSKEDRVRKELLELDAKLSGSASQELRREQIGNTSIYFGALESRFKVGETVIRVGLSEPAMELLQALQDPMHRTGQGLSQSFEGDTASIRRLLVSYENIFLRNDGIIGVSR